VPGLNAGRDAAPGTSAGVKRNTVQHLMTMAERKSLAGWG
jgi:hypothetical protein